MDRTVVGRREFGRVTGGRGPVATGKVAEASPVLADGVVEFIFADVFSRPGLSARERELVTVAVLCAMGGAEPQLGLHVPAAIEAGVDPDELVALCEQITPYAGFPRALNALRAVRAVLEDKGLPLPLPAERVALGDHETLVSDVGEGEGPALVLVHPLGLDRVVWRDVIRTLPADRRAIAFDVRGHGGAAGAPTAGLAGAAADLVAVLDARGVREPVHLVGAGTAAALTLAAAAALGQRAARVTLLGPVSALPVAGETGALTTWLSPASLAGDGFLRRYLGDRVARSVTDAWSGLAGELESVAGTPVRVLVGADDAEAARSQDLAVLLGAHTEVVPDAANLLPVEAPAAVAAALCADT